MPIYLIADIVGAIISQGWEQWFYRKYSPKSVSVYGMETGEMKSGKVKIG